jgi:hypothetical protein
MILAWMAEIKKAVSSTQVYNFLNPYSCSIKMKKYLQLVGLYITIKSE